LKALVTGASGQLGRALVARLGTSAHSARARQLDVTDAAAVSAALDSIRPDVVINATAYNKVDGAESAPEAAFAVNAAAVLSLALAAQRVGARLVHVSSDYVFDGAQSRPYVEDDVPRPINTYGRSKRAGEMMVEAVGDPRSSCAPAACSGRAGAGPREAPSWTASWSVRAPGPPSASSDDQHFAPTFARSGRRLVTLVDRKATGTVHVTTRVPAAGTSWPGGAGAGRPARDGGSYLERGARGSGAASALFRSLECPLRGPDGCAPASLAEALAEMLGR